MMATASGTLSLGSSSRIIAMPIGTIAMPEPWSRRATMSRGRPSESPPTRLAVATTASMSSMTRRLPYMSAMREATGVATAPASRVAVTIHEAPPAEVPTRSGSSGSSGSSIVCCSETIVPQSARIVMTSQARPGSADGSGPGRAPRA